MWNYGAIAVGLLALGGIAWAVSRIMKPAAATDAMSTNARENTVAEQAARIMTSETNTGDTKEQAELAVQAGPAKSSPEALKPTAEHIQILKDFGIRVEVTSTTPSQANPVQYVGELQKVAPEIWLLNPKATFQLKISSVNEETAKALKLLLDQSCVAAWGDVLPKLTSLISRTNIRSLEVDSYVGEYKRVYLKRIEELKTETSEWADASDRDREDLLKEFRKNAIEELPVRPSANLEILFEMDQSDLHVDDPLLEKYGYDVLNHYLYYGDKLGEVFCVPAEHFSRTIWMQSVAVGLARRGKDIPLEKLLESLTLKQMSKVSNGVEHTPFRRKARAIEFLVKLSDIEARLDRTVALRTLFQLVSLPPELGSVELGQIKKVMEYEREVAQLLQQTYVQTFWNSRNLAQSLNYLSPPREWEIYTGGQYDPCPLCLGQSKRRYQGINPPTVPLHIGCRCTVSPKL